VIVTALFLLLEEPVAVLLRREATFGLSMSLSFAFASGALLEPKADRRTSLSADFMGKRSPVKAKQRRGGVDARFYGLFQHVNQRSRVLAQHAWGKFLNPRCDTSA
jgi:hypothetical protein